MNDTEETGVSFSLQSVDTLLGATRAYITNKGEVDVGKVIDVLISKDCIQKVRIKGEKTALVRMERVFVHTEDAYSAAIKLANAQIDELKKHVAAMRGRVDNLRSSSK